MKKKIFLFVALFMLLSRANALTYNGCEYSTISRMKSLITNINISYNYKIIDNKAYFDVTLTNIFEDIYFVDSLSGKTYTYSDTDNGEITITGYEGYKGSYKFYSALDECYSTSLGTKYYTFPSYNKYYGSNMCSDVPNFSLCQKWVNVKYTEDEFKAIIEKYKQVIDNNEEEKENVKFKSDFLSKLVKIYINSYYYFLAGIIIICSIVMIIKRRKDRFKL